MLVVSTDTMLTHRDAGAHRFAEFLCEGQRLLEAQAQRRLDRLVLLLAVLHEQLELRQGQRCA